jgi:hypothetical protein
VTRIAEQLGIEGEKFVKRVLGTQTEVSQPSTIATDTLRKCGAYLRSG